MTDPSVPTEPALAGDADTPVLSPTVPAAAVATALPAAPAAGWSVRSMVSIAAVVVAISGGAVLTLLSMTARPAARDAAAAVTSSSRAGRPAAAAAGAAVPASTAPKWNGKAQARWVGKARNGVAFELAAERPVPVWNGTVTPLLVVRCLDKRTDVFVYTETAARMESEDENHTVRLAFDDQAGDHHRWPDSVEHDALFAPDGAALARQLMNATTLRFGFSPHNASPVTAVFDVHGLAERLKPVAKRCGGL